MPASSRSASATRSSVSALWLNAHAVTSAAAATRRQQHGERREPPRHERQPQRDADQRGEDAAAREAQQHRHDQEAEQRVGERLRRAPSPSRVPSHRQIGMPIAAVTPTAFQ